SLTRNPKVATFAKPARKKSKSPDSTSLRPGPPQQTANPKMHATTQVARSKPIPRAAAHRKIGTTKQQNAKPTLYACGLNLAPASVKNSSAGRLPGSKTGVFGYPAWKAGS